MNVKTALVVDDSKTARLTLRRQLEKRGVNVGLAESGEDAINYLKTTRPDIVFMDIMMPGMDGLEATKVITNSPETSNIPIVMCTSKDDEKSRNDAKENGARGFAVKPIKQSDLDVALALVTEQSEPAPVATNATNAADAAVQPTVGTAPITVEVSQLSASAEAAMRKSAEDMARDAVQSIARPTAEKIVLEIAESQAKLAVEKVIAEVVEQNVRSMVSTMVNDMVAEIVGDKCRADTQKMTEQVINEVLQERLQEVRDSFRKELKDEVRTYLHSNSVTTELQRIVQKRATSAAAVVTKKFATEVEDTAHKVANEAVRISIGNVRNYSVVLTLGLIGVITYLVLLALKMI